MTTAEEKLDLVIKEVKALQVGQLDLSSKVDTINTWSSNAEQFSIELNKSMTNLTSRITALEALTSKAPPIALPREEEGRAMGHGVPNSNQGVGARFQPSHPALVKGELPNPKSMVDGFPEHSSRMHNSYQFHTEREYKLPRVDFPKFYGEHPRIWREKCEKYFGMFKVPVHLWVPMATLNFDGNAALWLQAHEAQYVIENWHELCVAVEQKFGRDLYQNYMKDLLSIRQTSDVLEYSSRFDQAKHRVLVHNQHLDEVFLVQKFLDGLKYNISSAIALHKPRTVDAALSLALMQEQLLEASAKRYHQRTAREVMKPNSRSYAPVEASAPGILGATPASAKPPGSTTEPKSKWEQKVDALRALRRSQGLCMKCGEKWGRHHKCPPQVPLHVLEEVLDVMNLESSDEEEKEAGSSDEEILALSVHATEGIQGKKTLRLHGLIDKQEILILVDSGSSATFLSSTLTHKLNLVQEDATPVQVTVANGAKLLSNKVVPALTWWT